MKFRKSRIPQERELLHYQIQRTQLALETAYSNFDNVVDPELIDSFIYEVNAIQQRYQYLIQQIKELDNQLESSTIA
ncbi:MAG: YaaL family protein [Clostridium sp.]|nr:YaaL family protein [Clostridium sp.]